MPGVKAILTADDLPDLGPNVETRADERTVLRRRTDPRGRGRRRAHGRRSDREDQRRSRAAAVRRRSAREPASRRPERAHDGQRVGRRRCPAASGPNAASPLKTIKWTERAVCRRGGRPPADRRADRAMVVRRPRRRLQERRARPRRNLRRAVHRPPPDGNAQRDGLLAERQAVSPLLDAERRADGAGDRALVSASSRRRSC